MPDKKQLSEEDIKLRYITPAITKKWKPENIRMEAQITAGRINLNGRVVKRDSPKKADYLLFISPDNPIAVVEAKDNKHSVSHGMQQAKEYAGMLDVAFAYSSNGDAFEEFDFLTGREREISLDDFPSPDELYQRYKKEKGLTADEEKIISQPYYTSQTTNAPRYYQRVAINRTLEAIARGQNRILLVMATGTGKTYTAFQIVYRLLKSGLRNKVLYLADRNILVDQSISQDFKPLEKTIHKINFTREDPATISSYEVYFSLYQQLAGDGEDEDDEAAADVNAEPAADDDTAVRLASLFRSDFFDLVIVDECHRGSAKKDSNWRKILDYFSSATQIGMTATPKETKYVSNIDYFGEPVYTYSLKAGIEDGFLAPFRVINIKTSIGDGWRPTRGQKDKYGNLIEDRVYTNKDFDYNNGSYLSYVALKNSFGSIYGFKYLGVYQYTEYWPVEIPGVKGPNAPVVRDENGEVILNQKGKSKPMKFAWGTTHELTFKGGDAIYEDINHDGNINELDIVYLGSSLPKLNGGFSIRMSLGRLSWNNQFNFRWGNKIVNGSRMDAECMYNTNNTSAAVNWRWRVEGDDTVMPRALYQAGRNYLGSDRYVEDGSFLRWNFTALNYSLDPRITKKIGLGGVSFNLNLNNVLVWTKYTGMDPEVSAGAGSVAMDRAQTPRSKQVTFGVQVQF